LGRIGDHMLFYLRALGGVPHAAVHFRREIIRLIAEISMGAGTLAMIGGTVVIVGFLTLAAGGTLAVQGYSSLGDIGIEALTGFLAAFINVRISAPVVAGIGLAATFGAGVTAQLGAMRINEEIDALTAMAIRPVEYLVIHQDRRGDDRDHPAVLDRGGPVVCGFPVHDGGVVRTVRGTV
jgi:phospholipid/cholesterol/gamma-HCH transport system permease protein